jgi:electron-transferring-flavoprotein dehydrogenase
MTSVALTGMNHAEDQPVHLRVARTSDFTRETAAGNVSVGRGVQGASELREVEEERKRRQHHVRINVGDYAGLLGRACPAGVYEYVDDESSQGEEGWDGKKLVINSQVSFWHLQMR